MAASIAAAPASGAPKAADRIADVLSAAAIRLRAVSESPRLEAEVLLAHVLRRDRGLLVALSDEHLEAAAASEFAALLNRRAAGEPLAYLKGVKEFWSLTLKVTPDVLIPRPETELLVEWGLQIINGRREKHEKTKGPWPPDFTAHIVDLGTGSGAIALAIAKEHPDAHVIATDSSAAALEIAAENARRLGITNVEFRQGLWLFAVPTPVSRLPPLDLIVSNPPYVADNDPHLADLRYEPVLALTAGKDGLSALREISANSGEFLKPGGWLLLEHGAGQGSAVRELLRDSGFTGVQTRRDLAGLERATGGQKP